MGTEKFSNRTSGVTMIHMFFHQHRQDTLEKSTFFNKSNYRTTFPENETERMDGKDYGKLNTSLNRGYQDIQYKLSLYMEAKRSLISVTL